MFVFAYLCKIVLYLYSINKAIVEKMFEINDSNYNNGFIATFLAKPFVS